MWLCNKCGIANSDKADACIGCGYKLCENGID